MATSSRLRRVQRRDRVRQRRPRAPKAARQTRDLVQPAFDLARLAAQTYLSVAEFVAYGNFESENAARLFLSRYAPQVPTCRRGRRVFVRRVDYDRYMQASMER